MVQRWLQTLSNHQYVVKHRAGKIHRNADALSRAGHIPPADGSTDMDENVSSLLLEDKSMIHLLDSLADRPGAAPNIRSLYRDPEQPVHLSVHSLMRRHPSATQILRDQMDDPAIRQLIPLVQSKEPPTKDFLKACTRRGRILANEFLHLDVQQGLLVHSDPNDLSKRHRLVVPETKESGIITQAHSIMAHKGAEATANRLRRSFWFPSMLARTVETLVGCKR
jgi:hypothetical protein